jgi:hypothetical protein
MSVGVSVESSSCASRTTEVGYFILIGVSCTVGDAFAIERVGTVWTGGVALLSDVGKGSVGDSAAGDTFKVLPVGAVGTDSNAVARCSISK